MSNDKLIGRRALWTPPMRGKGSTIKINTTIQQVRSIRGRAEVMIVPDCGRGHAWVWQSKIKLLPVVPVNLY